MPVQEAFGDSMGLLSGWVTYLSYAAAGAALAIVCADFANIMVLLLSEHTIGIATSFMVVVNGFNWLGVREGAALQTVGSAIKLVLLIAFIAIAFLAEPPRPGFWSAATNGNAPVIGAFAVIAAYQMIYGAYTGWESAINFVEEDERALTNMPRAMALSIVAIGTVYVLFNLGIMKALDLEANDLEANRNSDLPVSLMLANMFGPNCAKQPKIRCDD